MKKYNKPNIEVLLFDEEDIETTSAIMTREGYTSADADTYQMAQDAGMGTGNTVHISTVKVTDITLDD